MGFEEAPAHAMRTGAIKLPHAQLEEFAAIRGDGRDERGHGLVDM